METELTRKVLMVDDDEDDCFLAREALKVSGVKAAFSSVEDGADVINYLSERSRSDQAGLPDLILLDLSMIRKDGRETLVEIKANPDLKHIPVVILTTSSEKDDISFTIQAGAESFVTKPATFGEWVEIMKSLGKRWLAG